MGWFKYRQEKVEKPIPEGAFEVEYVLGGGRFHSDPFYAVYYHGIRVLKVSISGKVVRQEGVPGELHDMAVRAYERHMVKERRKREEKWAEMDRERAEQLEALSNNLRDMMREDGIG